MMHLDAFARTALLPSSSSSVLESESGHPLLLFGALLFIGLMSIVGLWFMLDDGEDK